jgi:hypothetical protein
LPTTIHRNNNPMNGAGSETPSDEMATATLSGHLPRCKAAVTPISTPKIRNIVAAPIAIDSV